MTKLRYQTDEVDLFSDEDMDGNVQPISREDYERLLAYLQKKTAAFVKPSSGKDDVIFDAGKVCCQITVFFISVSAA